MASHDTIPLKEKASDTLYEATLVKHEVHNVAALHKARIAASGFNRRLAVKISKYVSTMPTAYVFALLSFMGLLGLLGIIDPFLYLLITWVSQQFLQLVFLPVLSVSQSVVSEHQELQSTEQYQATVAAQHNIEQILEHLKAQDKELIAQSNELLKQTPLLNKLAEQVVALEDRVSYLVDQQNAKGSRATRKGSSDAQ